MSDEREGSFAALFHIGQVQEESQNTRTTSEQVLLPNKSK